MNNLMLKLISIAHLSLIQKYKKLVFCKLLLIAPRAPSLTTEVKFTLIGDLVCNLNSNTGY